MKNCSYCGSHWDKTRDHVIPNSYLREGRGYEGDWLVPACKECNGTLGDILLTNVPDRATYLLSKYRRKYKKLLSFADWTDWELEDISDRLADSIRATRAQKQEMIDRINHLELVSGFDIEYMKPED